MRELKYRVYDKTEKCYSDKAFSIDQLGLCYVQDEDGYGEEIDEERYIVEQYTGLKDKNDKEIYEGDVVNIQGIKYYVDFEHGGFWFNNDNLKWKANRPFTHFQEINDTEVIGNIHENAELLEEEE